MPAYKAANICIFLLALLLSGCRETDISSTPELQVATGIYQTDTPVPACVSLPDVKLEVSLLTENAAQVRVTGLKPHESVFTIFSSVAEGGSGKELTCCPGETADENGSYKYSSTLRVPDLESEFKDWQVQVIHSRGAACAKFVLP